VSKQTQMPHRARMVTAVALALGCIAPWAVAQASGTRTSLAAETREVGGKTVATFIVTVQNNDGKAATGAVVLRENGRDLAGAALTTEGKAEIRLDSLSTGDHAIRAVYQGNSSASASLSESVVVHPQATATPDFELSIAPTSFTLKPGQAGTLVATITPINSFTGFISFSCSGAPITTGAAGGTSLPVGVSCVFTPANVQVVAPTTANPSGTVIANMSLQTTAPAGQNASLQTPKQFSNGHGTLALAILLPGALGLGLLGRKRNLLGRISLVLFVGTVALLGTSACSARYGYFHHPPTANDGTPTGTYTLTVTAQTSNGVSAATHSTPLALTVN